MLPLRFARVYLFSRKSTNAINWITGIAMTGIAVCSAAFILILSVFNGFEGLVLQLYDSFYPDIRIEAAAGKTFVADDDMLEQITALPGVRAASRVLEENALLMYDGRQQPARLKGVDAAFIKVAGLDTSMAYGDSFVLQTPQKDYAIIGSGIDQALEASLKDPLNKMSVFMPKRSKGRALLPGGDFIREDIEVWGVFVIQDEFDNQYVFVPIDFVRSLLEYEEEVSAIEIGLSDPRLSGDIMDRLENIAGDGFLIRNRYQQNALLYKVMNAERLVVYLILSFVLLIVAFNMIGALSMIVIDKKRDIAILKAMGADESMIQRIFMAEGLLQGVLSLLVGFAVATLLVLAQQQWGLIALSGSGTFLVQYYPVSLKVMDFVLVAGIVLTISWLASWFPARRAALQPHLRLLG